MRDLAGRSACASGAWRLEPAAGRRVVRMPVAMRGLRRAAGEQQKAISGRVARRVAALHRSTPAAASSSTPARAASSRRPIIGARDLERLAAHQQQVGAGRARPPRSCGARALVLVEQRQRALELLRRRGAHARRRPTRLHLDPTARRGGVELEPQAARAPRLRALRPAALEHRQRTWSRRARCRRRPRACSSRRCRRRAMAAARDGRRSASAARSRLERPQVRPLVHAPALSAARSVRGLRRQVAFDGDGAVRAQQAAQRPEDRGPLCLDRLAVGAVRVPARRGQVHVEDREVAGAGSGVRWCARDRPRPPPRWGSEAARTPARGSRRRTRRRPRACRGRRSESSAAASVLERGASLRAARCGRTVTAEFEGLGGMPTSALVVSPSSSE